MGGSALLVWSLLQTRLLRLRTLNLLGCFVLIGFNAAITPPGMRAPYYDRLGFTRDGDSYVLRLPD